VVGDLAGFVAATCLRGVPLIQVPTSLLAMVDSSVGGKTGINHPVGKNLIGAFYQPPVVVIDPTLLRTLPPRELRSGWGEIVKHAVIQPSTPGGERGDLLTFLDRNQDRLTRLQEPAITYAIRRNVALKTAVVVADEREAGVRALLNFGHTLGHAIEAAGYRLLHGEAISVGMVAAAEIGRTVGTCSQDTVDRITSLIARFGLPTSTAVDGDIVMRLIQSDKKKSGGKLRWVLPLESGGVDLRAGVPEPAVLSGLAAVNTG
jgi:3-dehydroquinate synthetase